MKRCFANEILIEGVWWLTRVACSRVTPSGVTRSSYKWCDVALLCLPPRCLGLQEVFQKIVEKHSSNTS